MAKSTRNTPQNPIPISNATAVEDLPPDTEAPEQVQSPAPPHQPAPPAPKRTPTFIETMNKVPKADWGPRANIYLYRTEPVIDRTRTGEPKFINVYAEPVTEERIMADYGSGRYKLMLNFRKPGADSGDVLDSMYVDILNMQYPPKIPLGEWTDDPKNKRWAWAKQALSPAPPPAPAPQTIDPLAAFGTFMDIQDRIEERVKPAPVQAPAAVVPAPVDPWAAAERILNMRSENPMVDVLKDELKAQREEMRAMRESLEKSRDREIEELRRKIEAPTAAVAPAKGPWESLIELGGDALKTRMTDFLFGGKSAAASEVVRPGRMNTLEFVSENLPKALDTFSPLIQAAAHKIMNPANGASANPGAAVQPAVTGDVFQKFITEIVTPKMLMYFRADPSQEGGEGFADWVYAGWPEHFDRIQKFSHPMMPGLVGEAAIITAYRNTPSIWSQIVPQVGPSHEAAFAQFVHGFCTYDPNAPEPDDPNIIDATPDGPEDLDSELEAIS